MATRAGAGFISEETICESPTGITPKRVKQNTHSRVIKVTSVLEPLLVVPGYKIAKGKVCLRDDGVPPFFIALPRLKIPKHHLDSPLIGIISKVNPLAEAPAARYTEPTQAT
jgi:hypothetical protein